MLMTSGSRSNRLTRKPGISWTTAMMTRAKPQVMTRDQLMTLLARSFSPAPMFWPTMVEAAEPMAIRGMVAKVSTLPPTP
jgi:hypothetical protein